MKEFSLRPARESDSQAIKGLIHLVQINPMALDWHRFLLAVDEQDRLIGCGQLKPHGKDIIELASIAVQPEYQGQGVGSAVVTALLARAPRPIYLTCRGGNGPYYERWGFRALKQNEMPRYYQRLARIAAALGRLTKDDEGMLVMELK